MTIDEAYEFLRLTPLALVGVSSTGKRFGAMAFRTLVGTDCDIVPIHPQMERFEGHKCYQNLSKMREPPIGLILITRPESTMPVLEECRKLGVLKVWFQPGSESEEAVSFCRSNGIIAYKGFCILLFSGGFPHNLHLFILKLLGKIK